MASMAIEDQQSGLQGVGRLGGGYEDLLEPFNRS